VLVLSHEDVRAHLNLDRLPDAVGEALAGLSDGRAQAPERVAVGVPSLSGLLAAMPAYLPSPETLVAKLVTIFPANSDRPTHQALVCCFEPATGSPLAVMDGSYLTAARTAAASALATRWLARPDAQVVVIVGTGAQARSHALALRDRGSLVVAGRDPRKAEALAAELAGSGLAARAAGSIEDAVRVADVVCLTTHAERPVIRRDWLKPGTHVNSVGYNTTGEGELDAATVASARLVVESRRAALAPPPAGSVELRTAQERGISLEPVELGDIVSGRAQGRQNERQVTLYKSVGVAVEDAAAARLVLDAVAASSHGREPATGD